ncbi:MAG: FAD-binding oxidoreductase [Nitrospinae bacterium]|nr:FAD-binding oxidoreductase [Nitrospinota bacterium]
MIRKTSKETIAPYLRDASNYSGGVAEEVLIPENPEELTEVLKNDSRPVTIAGAGTGLTASRIPSGGIIISLEKFNEMESPENGEVWVGPALTLTELQESLNHSDWFYPPNPTETNASIGGTLATNASGSRSFKFGVTRDFVHAAECVLSDGRKVLIKRGHKISEPLCMDDGSQVRFPEITYTSPKCKNTAGYYVQPEMDWLDLFIGSDGTLGIFTKICLKLIPQPAAFLSGVLFFGEEKFCWDLTTAIKSQSFVSPCSLEYFDRYSLEVLREKYPNIPSQAKAALFFEEDVEKQEMYDAKLENWFNFLEDKNILLDESWFSQNEKDNKTFHEFRHEIPILINEKNSRAGREKIGTDMAVSDNFFIEMMEFYEKTLSQSQIPYVIFGHLGDNHLHINLLPKPDQLPLAGSVYDEIAHKIISWKGTVSAEHGIGKKKRKYLYEMVGQKNIDELKKIKSVLDPKGRLGKGNLF